MIAMRSLIPGHRRVTGQVNDGIAALRVPEGTLLSGDNVRLRFIQSAYWGVVAALLGAGFVAGLYDGLWQVHWYVHVGPVHFEIFWLKGWWDNLIRYPWWALYRHGAFRDLLEPAVATIFVKTLMASRKTWGRRVGPWRLALTPFLVILLACALGVIGIWVIDFSGPWAWQHVTSAVGHPGFKLSAHFLGKLSVPQIALGIGIGQAVHRLWAPCGAHLQGVLIDRSVDRRQSVVRAAGSKFGIGMNEAAEMDRDGWHIIPAWVRHAFSPPVIRERWAATWRSNVAITAHRAYTGLVAWGVFIAFLITLLGLVGHYWAGAGHTVPYLFPGH